DDDLDRALRQQDLEPFACLVRVGHVESHALGPEACRVQFLRECRSRLEVRVSMNADVQTHRCQTATDRCTDLAAATGDEGTPARWIHGDSGSLMRMAARPVSSMRAPADSENRYRTVASSPPSLSAATTRSSS